MLPTYARLLNSNGFINISVHGYSKRKEYRKFDGYMVSKFGIRYLQIDDASVPDTTRHDQGEIFVNAGQWIVQETNTVKNQHLRVMDSEAIPYPRTTNAKNTVPLDMGSKNLVLAELHTDRFTLDNWKYYLESCAAYHTFFVREFLDRVYLRKTAMNGSFNVGIVTTNTRGWYGEFKVWLNESGIANLLSIPMIEDSGYIVSTHTKGDWIVTNPKVKKSISKGIQEYTRVCHTSSCMSTRKELA